LGRRDGLSGSRPSACLESFRNSEKFCTLAEDLMQDVFFSVWRNAAGFDPSRAGFSTWVSCITRNRAIDLARRRRARVQTVAPPAGEVAIPELGEDDGTEEILRHFDVAGALSRISPAHHEVLALAYLGGSRSARSTAARVYLWARSRAAPPRPCVPHANGCLPRRRRTTPARTS
jgi:RNA polymerase sigma factor (sigma-70 family)